MDENTKVTFNDNPAIVKLTPFFVLLAEQSLKYILEHQEQIIEALMKLLPASVSNTEGIVMLGSQFSDEPTEQNFYAFIEEVRIKRLLTQDQIVATVLSVIHAG